MKLTRRKTILIVIGAVALSTLCGIPCLVMDERVGVNQRPENTQLGFLPSDEGAIKSNKGNYTLVHMKRIQHLKTICENPELLSHTTYKGRKRSGLYYSEEYDFAYSKVPKAGCTFWTQVFLILNNHSIGETFEMKRHKIHLEGRKLLTAPKYLNIKRPRMILTSRDPYSRLYSAYIDKIFLGLLPEYRKMIGDTEAFCNFNISFKEFLRYIIQQSRANLTLNVHFAPIFSISSPCEVNEYRIVKQETFTKDVEFVLNEINLPLDKYRGLTNALHDNRIEATVPGIVKTTFTKNRLKDATRCIGFEGIAKRLWLSFQIQGFLNKNIDFPWHAYGHKGDLDVSNHSKFTDIILDTIKMFPLTPEESKAQRHEALVNAYKYVSPSSIAGIQDVYRPDFMLYNYDLNPPT